MEIESDNGDNFYLQPDALIFIGRSHANDDRTVSRRHISLKLRSSNQKSDQPRVSLEVVGKNPVWVREGRSDETRVYLKGERAELRSSDAFSIFGKKKHVWFRLRSEDEVALRVEDEEVGDVSEIDLVKEFGFVIMGHEFDSYSKQMIHDVKKWNWFLEEPKRGSDDDDDDKAGQRSKRRRNKRKKGKCDGSRNDSEWECESEEDKDLISNTKKVSKPTYSTRSKDRGKLTEFGTKGKGKSKPSESKNTSKEETGDEYENEDDETLGGFIVENEEEIADEMGSSDKEDEEEDFEDDEDLD